jgi:hypothetical protein
MSVAADLIEVTGVEVLGQYRLLLTFSDGRAGVVDVSDVKDKGGLFAALRDPAYFAKVRVDREVGTIAWPNGLDFAPERLYREAMSHPVSRPRARRGVLSRVLSGLLDELARVFGGGLSHRAPSRYRNRA